MVSVSDFPVEDVIGFARSQSWVGLAVTFLLSTLVSGIVLVLVVGLAAKRWGEGVKVQNAFLLALAVNLITFFGLPFAGGLLSGTLLLAVPIAVWIVLAKALFPEFSVVHAVVIGIIGYAISLFAVPQLVGALAGFFPSFGL